MKKRRLRGGMLLLSVGLAVVALASTGDVGPTMLAEASPLSDRVLSPNVLVVAGSPSQRPAMPAGMVVAIDPVTGARRAPTADERADLSAATRFGETHSDGASLHQFLLEGGGTGLLLDSRYVVSEAISLSPDGTWAEHHQVGAVRSMEALRQAVVEAREADTTSLTEAAAETDDVEVQR